MGSRALRNVLRSSPSSFKCIPANPLHTRPFTCSSATMKQPRLPVFPPTSSPELDALLASFRDQVFAPNLLSKRYRALLYQRRHAPTLTTEDISLDLSTTAGTKERYTLRPLSRTHEPRLRALLPLLKEPRDLDVLPAFLVGLHNSDTPAHPHRLGWQVKERLARILNRAGRQDVLFTLVRGVERTGFVVDRRAVAEEVMWGAHLKAREGAWEEEAVKKGLKMAEQVMELLEDPRHAGTPVVEGNPRAAPTVVGVLLELAAVHAVKFCGGQDADGKVGTAIDALRRVWPSADFATPDDEGTAGPPKTAEQQRHIDNRKLVAWCPVLHGLKSAAQVEGLNVEQTVWLEKVTPGLDAALAELARGALEGSRGAQWYSALLV